MTIQHPDTIVVSHLGYVVATCTVDRVYFAPAIEGLPEHHPDRAHVAAKCLIAGAILNGEAAGPFVDAEADEAARLLTDHLEVAQEERRRARQEATEW